MKPNPRTPRQGGAAIEFALLLPVLVAIIFGGMDYSWYFHQLMAVQDAVRQGARTGASKSMDANQTDGTGTCQACIDAAVTRATETLTLNGLENNTTITAEVVTLSDGDFALRVVATVPYVSIGGAPPIPTTPTNLYSELTMRIDAQ